MKVARRKRVVWYPFPVHRAKWKCVLVPKVVDPCDPTKELRGLTLFERKETLVEYCGDYTLMCRTALHEMAHAFIGPEAFQGEDEPRKDAMYHMQEHYVRKLEGPLYVALIAMGFVFPPIPDEASLLAA